MSKDIMAEWSSAKSIADFLESKQVVSPICGGNRNLKSKLFLGPGEPATRLDCGHSSHNETPHLHLGKGEALNLPTEVAVRTYADMTSRQMIANATYKVSGSDG